MSPSSIVLLAFGMSIDALIAAAGRGVTIRRPGLAESLRTGLVFGVVEAVTPLVGWALGVAASAYVAQVDHWVAFGLLSAVGLRMIYHAAQRDPDEPPSPAQRSFAVLLATAVGTSLDAMAVGVSLAFLDVNILVIAAAIGAATTLMSTGGMLAGHLLGARFGRYAEIAGGLALVAIGTTILVEHLTAS